MILETEASHLGAQREAEMRSAKFRAIREAAARAFQRAVRRWRLVAPPRSRLSRAEAARRGAARGARGASRSSDRLSRDGSVASSRGSASVDQLVGAALDAAGVAEHTRASPAIAALRYWAALSARHGGIAFGDAPSRPVRCAHGRSRGAKPSAARRRCGISLPS